MNRLILEAGGTPSLDWATLSVCSPMGSPVLANQKNPPRPFEIKKTNYNADIDGATYINKYAKWAVKDSMGLSLQRRAPRAGRNVPDLQLIVSDIDGASYLPSSSMERSDRHVNPLSPSYSLPSYAVPLPQIDMRPIRNVLLTSDIVGSQPSPYETRDILNVADIAGAQSSSHFMTERQRQRGRVDMTVEEMKPRRFQDRTTRCTDTLQPAYTYGGLDILDDALRSKPKKSSRFVHNGTYTLTTSDVAGATPGSLRRARGEIRNIMSTMDVQGAQADTIVHSIRTLRTTNPLSPVYQGLNFGEPLPPVIAPLISPDRLHLIPSLRLMKPGDIGPLSGLVSPIRTS